jgi:hypothetical protein
MDQKHTFVPAIEELSLARLIEVWSDIRDFLGVKPRAYIGVITGFGLTIRGVIKMAELREGQRVTATAVLKTAGGNPAAYQTGSAVWTSSDPAVASVLVHPDNELMADVDGLNGAANTPVLVTFTADGDPDADQVRDVVATLDVVVTQGEAVVAEVTAGPATDIPTP